VPEPAALLAGLLDDLAAEGAVLDAVVAEPCSCRVPIDRRSVAGRVRALALTGLVALGGILRVRGPATGLVVAGRVALGGF
jgi:hypothetical protein